MPFLPFLPLLIYLPFLSFFFLLPLRYLRTLSWSDTSHIVEVREVQSQCTWKSSDNTVFDNYCPKQNARVVFNFIPFFDFSSFFFFCLCAHQSNRFPVLQNSSRHLRVGGLQEYCILLHILKILFLSPTSPNLSAPKFIINA